MADLKRKRSANWTQEEEITLLEEVKKQEEVLFGKIKGCGDKGGIMARKNQTWQNIADILNSRFLNGKKDVDIIKKKYANIKQRSKSKLDDSKRPPTGGGHKLTFSQSEEVFLDLNEDRPNVSGIQNGFDTDEVASGNTCQDIVCSDLATGLQCGADSQNEHHDAETSDIPIKKKKKNGNHRSAIADLERRNLELDCVRLEEEIQKIKEERAMIKEKTEMIRLQKKKLAIDICFVEPSFEC